ncbi:Phospholipase D family [Cynara cardunculus var. scolymus]|uniref:phospholipase D n=1 Tax=Cynara cardunculus var. scolymus TaxID=59895 RepID=A0A103XMV8_CYNCS|nr:Phospholipase D family [Cynara cardunculus var. scolymus]
MDAYSEHFPPPTKFSIVCSFHICQCRSVPTRAALAIIRPSIRRTTVLERAKVAMQNYLNHFLGNIDIVNSREVCQFLEVSKLSFSPEYGPKLKEGYILVQHLSHIQSNDADAGCFMCCCCRNNWQKVWAVLKPGFLALLEDSFSTKLLDIIVFDALPPSNGEKEDQVLLAEEVKERNPLRYAFKVFLSHFTISVTCGNRSTKIRSTSKAKVRNWITAINNTGQKPIEGWCNSHRFGSFAPQRGLTDDGSQAQWFVDGQVAFEAIALSIANAKSEVQYYVFTLNSGIPCIMEQQIYILMYKEVAIALKINSLYSQKRLLNIHENVKVLRYPDHFAAGIYLSHHEKIVVVDHQICFLGGLDLCFGRYDTIEHKVSDCPPFIWPGKDYYNPRESEPNSWVDTMTDELDRRKYPRMPWHDVHCALWGPPCRDVARHFVQRWNHAKRNKAPNEQTIPLLMPQQHMVLPHYMGRSQKLDIESKPTDGNQIDIMQGSSSYESPSQDIHFLLPQEADVIDSSNANNTLNGLDQRNQLDLSHDEHLNHAVQTVDSADDFDSMDRQHENSTGSTSFGSEISDEGCEKQEVIRSVCHWSGGTSQTEDSIHKAYCSLIEKAEKFVYIENQFFISGLSDDDVIQNRVLEALYRLDDRITLIGSSNINDRSLLGHRDSEIGILIKDREFTESTMNGEPWNAGKFANSLRLSLWSEHLGLHGDEIREIRDPIADKTYKDLWSATARANSQIYQDVYAFRQSMNFWKEKLGHTTIDLGVAPEKLESLTSMEILKQVRGFLVSFPLQFMCQEDLRPMFSESEFYASPQVFY